MTLHQMGNEREHDWYWYLTEIYQSTYHQPALNGEPYYAGYKDEFGLGDGGYKYGADGGSDRDNQYVRSSMYGSFLFRWTSGTYLWRGRHLGADIEPASPVKMWDAFQWRSGAGNAIFEDLRVFHRKTLSGPGTRRRPSFSRIKPT